MRKSTVKRKKPLAQKSFSRERLKIKKLRICDFRAFAGPETVEFELDGKNLLVYGENGAGKSSVFHALNELFVLRGPGRGSRKRRFAEFKNRFSSVGPEVGFVEIEFDDGKAAAKWNNSQHPVDRVEATISRAAKPIDRRILGAAFQKAILDYRSLLATNYQHGDGEINLFEVCIEVLLRDYRTLPYGTNERLVLRWRALLAMLDRPQIREADKEEITKAALVFTEGLREAIEALLPKANELLVELGWEDVKLVSLTTPGVTYNNSKTKGGRAFDGCVVAPEITFRGQKVETPQTFLNEARLSALALAIYFAGRQVCTETLQEDTPRLIVLDDVLIGLDQSNRMPVLRMLDKHFPDWQVVLLTHDRVWYEMARFHLADRTDWASVEMFEEKQPDGTPMPIAGPVRPFVKPTSIDAIAANIATARKFHGMNEYAAAAVHARVAFELTLKKLCERKSIPVRFKTDPRELNTEDLLTAIETWLDDTKRAHVKPSVEPAIKDVRLARKVVLNQFSHSTPVSLADIEVKSAIDAVEKLHADFHAHIPK